MNVIFFRQLALALVGIQTQLRNLEEQGVTIMATFADLTAKIDASDAKLTAIQTAMAETKTDLEFAVGVLAANQGGLSGDQVGVLFNRLGATDSRLAGMVSDAEINAGFITPPVVEPSPPA